MGFLRKATKAVGKEAKKAAKTAVKVIGKDTIKQMPARKIGQVVGSLARGKTPRREDVLGALGIRTRKRTAKRAKQARR